MSATAWAAPVKVAFTGDQDVGENAQAVLSLIASEGTDLLMIQGDLGYSDDAAASWEANLTNALGADFPVLSVVGNHENYEWPIYQRYIQQRIERASGLSCTGEAGVKAHCRFENLDIVQVSPGIHEVEGVNGDDDYAGFISSSFADATARWRICSWHKNQNEMQTGSKGDSTGWDVYDSCLNAGAMVALAHEHAYSRTHLLSDFRNQTVVHKNSEMTLESGKSFAFVSGLGGREIREQKQGGDWWASIYTATQGASYGALFCTFEEVTASCYFKAIDGAVPDQFSLISQVGSAPLIVRDVLPEPESEVASETPVEANNTVSTAPVDTSTPVVTSSTQPVPESGNFAAPPQESEISPLAIEPVAEVADTSPADALNGDTSAEPVQAGKLSFGLLSLLLLLLGVRRARGWSVA